MKTNMNKIYTRAQIASINKKVKAAKRIGVGGYISNTPIEFFNVSILGMIAKEEAVALLEEGNVILGNEKFDLSKGGMFCLAKHWSGKIVLSVNGDVEEHGWIENAVSAFGRHKMDAESIDEAITACSIMNSMHKLYGYQCWFKYDTARIAVTMGASEEEAFWIAHYISYQQHSLLKADEVLTSSINDLWDILRIDDDIAMSLSNDLFHITKGGPISVGILLSYGEDFLNKQRMKAIDRNARYSDDVFYKNMYHRIYKKGYWELDAIYHSTVNLIKEGKNRLAKLQPDVYGKNIAESISATGIDRSKFKSLTPQCEAVICEFFSVLNNNKFKAFVKSYNGEFASITDAMQKMLQSKGIKTEPYSVFRDYWNMNTPGCFDALVEFSSELRGRTVNFNTPGSIIERFAGSSFESLSDFANIMQAGLDPDERTEPSALLKSIKGANTEGMDMWVLPKSDHRNLTMGDITGCCQKIGGAGEEVCKEGWTDPYSINIVFGDRKADEFYAHAWVWETSKGDIVLDSIEGRSFVNHATVSKLVLELAAQMKEKDIRIYLSDTSYGLTKDVVSRLKAEGYISQDVCPDSITEYSYMDSAPGEKCWLIKV